MSSSHLTSHATDWPPTSAPRSPRSPRLSPHPPSSRIGNHGTQQESNSPIPSPRLSPYPLGVDTDRSSIERREIERGGGGGGERREGSYNSYNSYNSLESRHSNSNTDSDYRRETDHWDRPESSPWGTNIGHISNIGNVNASNHPPLSPRIDSMPSPFASPLLSPREARSRASSSANLRERGRPMSGAVGTQKRPEPPVHAKSLQNLMTIANAPSIRRPDIQRSQEKEGLLLWVVKAPGGRGMLNS
jgi:hypothetical protein